MSGRYKAYGEYKESGVEWLGEAPEDWFFKKAKYIFKKIHRATNTHDGIITAFRDGQVTLRANRRVEGFTNALKEIGYQGVETGDLLIHSMDGFAGAIGISDSDGKCSPVCSVCIPIGRTNIHTKYYGYLVRQLAVTGYILSLAKGIRERSTEFRFNEFSALDLPMPKLKEQTQIAAFLDHETAKIDTLIDKQQQLIELLKEKRQAVISHAVTKGLDPDVPMKDSGVDWLGEVPEHWEQCSLSKLFDIKAGGDINLRLFSTLQSNDYPFPIYTNTNNEFAVYGYTCKANFLKNTITVTGRGDVGFAVFRDHDYDAIIRLLVLAPIKYIFCKFFTYFINEVINFKVESSAIGQLSTQQISPYKVVFPSFDEQHLIATFLDHETAKIDTLIDLQQQQIELLKERRTALISAAVTGKIDVRDWQVPVTQTESDEVMA